MKSSRSNYTIKSFRIRTILFLILSCFSCFLAFAGNEYIGISSIKSLRNSNKKQSIGRFIQARIQKNLLLNTEWKFHELETMHLWENSKQKFPVNANTTFLIKGNFLLVVNKGILNLEILSKKSSIEFKRKFNLKEIDQVIDSLTLELAQYISPRVNFTKTPKFPRFNSKISKAVYQNVEKRQNSIDYTIEDAIRLKEFIFETSAPEGIIELTKSLNILSAKLNDSEKNQILKPSEILLRKATKLNSRNSDLIALHALTFFQLNSYPSWVESKGRQALKYDPQSELANLIMAMASDLTSGAGKSFLNITFRINPYLPEHLKQNTGVYYRGIFDHIKIDVSLITTPKPETDPENDSFREEFQKLEDVFQDDPSKKSIQTLLDFIDRHPNKIEPIIYLAHHFFNSKDFKATIDFLTPYTDHFPNSVEVSTILGESHYFLKQLQLAEKYLETSLVLQPRHLSALKRISLVKIRLKKSNDALIYIEKLLVTHPENASFWFQRGLAYWYLENWNETIRSWEKSLQLDPSRAERKHWLEKAKNKQN